MNYPKSKYTKEDLESLWEVASKDEILFNTVISSLHAALVEKHFPPLKFSGEISEELLKPGSTMPRTIEDLKEGDILLDDSEQKVHVLAKCGKVYCISQPEPDSNIVDVWLTLDEMKDENWTLHQEPEPKKVTISREAFQKISEILKDEEDIYDSLYEIKSMVE